MIKNNDKIKIALVLGTGRKGRMSERVFNFVFEEISKDDRFLPIKVDVRDYTFGLTDDSGEGEMALKWKDIVTSSNALIFVSPEYNRSYPGELKILIDSLSDEYDGKLAGVCSVSSGGFGGVRMAEKLKALFIVLNMRPLRNDIAVSSVVKEFDEKNLPINPQFYIVKIKSLLDEIAGLV
jgi:NAD(P)H-dependent FMN reductase